MLPSTPQMVPQVNLNQAVKLSVIAGMLLVGASAGYYFVHFLPKQRRTSQNQTALAEERERQKECQKIGEQLYQKDKEWGENNTFVDSVHEPHFTYNKELNTCLYSGGSSTFTESGSADILWIKDSYTGEKVVFVSLSPAETREEANKRAGKSKRFWEKHKQLFGFGK